MKPGQTIGVREKSRNLAIVKEAIEVNNFVPDYLTFDAEKLEGTFTRLPERSEFQLKLTKHLSLSSTLVNNSLQKTCRFGKFFLFSIKSLLYFYHVQYKRLLYVVSS